MSKTRLLCSLISMKTHSSFFSHSTSWPFGKFSSFIFKQAESHLCSLFLLPLWWGTIISHLDYCTQPLFSPPASAPTHRPHRTPLLAQKPEWVTLNVSPCWSHACFSLPFPLAIPRALCGPLPLYEWFSSGSMDLWMSTQVPVASTNSQRCWRVIFHSFIEM